MRGLWRLVADHRDYRLLLSTYLPQLLLAATAGVLVDRWNRRRTNVAANLLQAAGLLPLLLVHGGDQVWIVTASASGRAVSRSSSCPRSRPRSPTWCRPASCCGPTQSTRRAVTWPG